MIRRLPILLLLLLFVPALQAQNESIAYILPDHVVVGSPNTTVTVFGRAFRNGPSVVKFNGSALSTTFLSPSIETAVIPSTALTAQGTFSVQINTTSNVIPFRVLSPIAAGITYTPQQFIVGQDTAVTVTGQDFVSNSTLLFDWQPLTTTFVSSTKLTGTVPGSMVIGTGAHHIQVYNGAFPGGSITIPFPNQLNLGTISVSAPAFNIGGGNVIRDQFGTVTLATPWFTLTGPNAADFAVSTTNFTPFQSCTDGLALSANDRCFYTLTATPTTTTTETATLTILSNATNGPQTVALSVHGSSAKTIALSPQPFGTVAIGSAQTNEFDLTAAFGSFALSTPYFTITGTNAADFSVTGGTCANGATLSATCTSMVAFSPTGNGARTATFTTSSGADNVAAATLTGTGATAVSHTIRLDWTASTAAGVVGYNIRRALLGGTFGSPLNGGTPVNAVTYTDSTVVTGTSYFYSVTAVGGPPNWPTGTESTAVISNVVTP